MTLDLCITCKFHTHYEQGAVYCGYGQNISSMAVVEDPRTKVKVVLACPKEKYKIS